MKKKNNTKTGIVNGSRQNTVWSDIVDNCDHQWQPLSFVFETQLLDNHGRVGVRQPEINEGRVYCICMKCCSHTYIVTAWAGFYINSPDLVEEAELYKRKKELKKKNDQTQ